MDVYRAEFLVEPFTEGTLGPPVLASLEAAEALGFTPEIGPFGTTIDGPCQEISDAVAAVIMAAMDDGATRVSIQVSRPDPNER